MALTATATKATRRCIMQKLGMANTKVINISPEKSNIYLCVSEKPSVEEFVGKIVAIITRKGQSASKLLIFCRTYDTCHRFYRCFKSALGQNFTIPNGAPDLPQFRIIDMYARCTQLAVKEHIISEFVKEDGKLRVVVATVAFSMGIDCPNISCVVHWGPTDTVEDYVQEIGRAGRNTKAACALAFYSNSVRYTWTLAWLSKAQYIINVRGFNGFDSFNIDTHSYSGCKCCFVCAKSCTCGHCEVFLSEFVYLKYKSHFHPFHHFLFFY